MTRAASLFAVLALAAPSAAAPDVLLGDGSPATRERVEARAGAALRLRPAWVASEGFTPLRSPSKDSPPSGAPPLKFLTRVTQLTREQTDTNYLLVGRGDPERADFEIIGWVPLYRAVTDLEARRDASSTILLKAMIVNTVELVGATEGGRRRVEPAPVLLAPDRDGPRRSDSFRLFSIYFVYGDTAPADERAGFLLLGAGPSISRDALAGNDAAVADTVLGWVAKDRLCMWRTREALEWEQAGPRPPVRVYRSEKDARAAGRGSERDPLYSERLAGDRPAEWDPKRMRYPVLPLDAERLSHSAGDNHLRRVGVYGGFVNDRGEAVEGADPEKIDAMQQKIAELEQEVAVTELLFVIDDSTSMEKWFPRVAEVITDLTRQVRQSSRRLRVGVTYYADVHYSKRGDGEQLAAAVKPAALADSDSPEAKAALKELQTHAQREGFDAREQVFLGLRTALEQAQFTPYARKIVVLVGDMGDHDHSQEADRNRPADELARLRERAREEIVNLLAPKRESPVEFYALQVDDPGNDADAAAFRDQARDLAERFRKRVNGERPAGYFPVRNPQGLRDIITQRFTKIQSEIRAAETALAEARRGAFSAVTQIGPEMERILRDKGVDLAMLRQANGFQVFEYGYVWDKNAAGTNQVRRRLLLSDGELRPLRDILQTFFGAGDRLPTLKEVAGLIAKEQAGELEKEDNRQRNTAAAGETEEQRFRRFTEREESARRASAETVLKAKYGFSFVSPLLTKAADDLETLEREKPQEALRLLPVVRKKLFLIEDLLNGKRHSYAKLGDADAAGLVREQPGEDLDRGFYLHGGKAGGPSGAGGGEAQGRKAAVWYWVDYEREWP